MFVLDVDQTSQVLGPISEQFETTHAELAPLVNLP